MIAQGAFTNSKRPDQNVDNCPKHLVRGKGCFVWDVDGNKYLDYIGSLGANLLGYCHPKVDEAIRKQLEKGCTHSLPTTLECEVAELIIEKFPFIEKMKFFKTGSEACSAAVRIARAYQQKKGESK